MKLSEIWDAINNGSIENDLGDNRQVFILMQDSTNLSKVEVRGTILGDDDLMAKMLADRMLKDKDFRDMITSALKYYLGVIISFNNSENKPS